MSKPIDQELLPCPFCGCQPKEYDQIGYSSVKCKPCGFSIKVKSMDGPPYAPELWNTRASVQPAGVAVSEYGSYTTRCGEMVAGIALRQLGAEKRWIEIRDLNAHAFPGIGANDMYPPGTELIMPAAPHPVSGEQKASTVESLRAEVERAEREWQQVSNRLGELRIRLAACITSGLGAQKP